MSSHCHTLISRYLHQSSEVRLHQPPWNHVMASKASPVHAAFIFARLSSLNPKKRIKQELACFSEMERTNPPTNIPPASYASSLAGTVFLLGKPAPVCSRSLHLARSLHLKGRAVDAQKKDGAAACQEKSMPNWLNRAHAPVAI